MELGAPHVARYLAAAEYAVDRRVLDAGSGTGYGARLLKSAGAASVLGVEIEETAVRQAGEQFGDPQVCFVHDDCQTLSKVAGPFDLICNFEAIEHFAEPEKFLHRAGELLAPDGVLLISTPDRADTPPFVNGRPRNQFHLYEWYRDEFRQILDAHFTSVDFRVQVRIHSLESRKQAIKAIRQGFMWSNPLATLIWRKLPLFRKRDRPWKKLAWLATPCVADYPIVPLPIAPLYGVPAFHFAICRGPKGCGQRRAA